MGVNLGLTGVYLEFATVPFDIHNFGVGQQVQRGFCSNTMSNDVVVSVRVAELCGSTVLTRFILGESVFECHQLGDQRVAHRL